MNVPELKLIRRTLLVGSLAFATCAFAQTGAQSDEQQASPPPAPASTTMSDAQIESNVLRALATNPALSTQNIQSTTVYGTVTLTGNVENDALRTQAENLVARALGVKKVVDEMTLGNTPPSAEEANPEAEQPNPAADQASPEPGQQDEMQSDGAPAPPEGDQGPPPQAGAPDNGQYPGGYGPPQDNSADNGQNGQQPPQGYGPPQGNPPPNGQQYPGGYGSPQGQYQGQQQPYSNQAQGQPYPPDQGAPGRRPLYENGNQPPPNYAPPGGQQAGLSVTIPAGALLRVRIDRGIDSKHIAPGTQFSGTVLSDVAAGGAIAIPRGATVQGSVIDAKGSGALKGRGELSLAINSVTLGGNVYPLTTQLWQRATRDKTGHTVGNAVGLGLFGAIIGGIAGGGAGAVVGAGVGGAAGVASSAASPDGRVIVPPEAVLNFHLSQPATVQTVSEQEMNRLSYAAGAEQPQRRYPRRYHPNYYAPY